MQNKREIEAASTPPERSRVLPLLIAGVFCFCVAALVGFGSWRLFGSTARHNGETARFFEKFGISTARREPATKDSTPVAVTPVAVPSINPTPAAETSPEIKGAVDVDGGESVIGGGVSKRPLKREFVEDFLISDTEVTNQEYAEFVSATGYRAPDHWKNGKPSDSRLNHPVVFVSVKDANRFCKWKAENIGMEVRLPTYAEWQRAAGGVQRFKYPWGNEWNETAVSSEKKRTTSAVKSFELNRSPYDAYDMVGNVWEWTSEQLKKNELVSEASKSGYSPQSRIHLVLGGSFSEDRSKLANSFWAEIDASTRNKSVGFRYVIIPESN